MLVAADIGKEFWNLQILLQNQHLLLSGNYRVDLVDQRVLESNQNFELIYQMLHFLANQKSIAFHVSQSKVLSLFF